MNNKYYTFFIKEIEQLIANENYEQAKVKLKFELDLPYIPKKYEQQIIKFYNEIQQLTKEKPNIKQWDLETIKEIINNPFDEEIHLVAFNFLEQQNARKILSTLRDYLKNSLFRNENKTYLLIVLKRQDIDEVFIVQKTHGQYFVNPILISEFHLDECTKKVKTTLSNFVYNDNPSLEQVCWYLWENYWYSQYPNLPLMADLPAVVSAIIYKAQIMQGDDECKLEQICQNLNTDVVLTERFLLQIEKEQIF
ncbi:hypothetical protein [Spiroplasma endosymbiont of Clivina fossor]|uniref:hypothetical protein n=1 Tax=Spiroplasma endosymbiont of Clivina fossor TaxID=3066282 RepID=UPI00313F273B